MTAQPSLCITCTHRGVEYENGHGYPVCKEGLSQFPDCKVCSEYLRYVLGNDHAPSL